MKPKFLLRIAATAMLLHTAGHTLGALTWQQAPNQKIAAVISGMQTEHFEFMGRSVTLAGFFMGYGIIMIFVMLFITTILWLLSDNPIKTITLALALLLLATAVSEYIYFFPLPALLSSIAAICTAWAYLKIPLKQQHYE
ncbi:hypothetical protein ACFFGT_27780 [Mucilaginibacter angelicae]|uniref:DUF4064 domain-containing protein n=1 Tax=Mucilaginibacter angelicae TaxID=869718 RepID=A0ABV6LF11_9SPHI